MLWQRTLYWLYFFKMCLGVFYGPKYSMSCWMFPMSLKRMWILLLEEAVHRRQLYPVDLMELVNSTVSLLIFCLLNVSILSKINIATPVFLSLVLAWYIFLLPFTFNLNVSLYLKWISYGNIYLGLVFRSSLTVFVF